MVNHAFSIGRGFFYECVFLIRELMDALHVGGRTLQAIHQEYLVKQQTHLQGVEPLTF